MPASGAAERPLDVLLLYNQPVLAPGHPDSASEAGVLEAVEAAERALAHGGHVLRRQAVGDSPDELLASLRRRRPGVILNLCEGLGGVGAGESQVAGLLELCGVPFTGSGSECLSLARDKARTKWLLRGAGLPTADFQRLTPGDRLDEAWTLERLSQGPLIVKPACEDASLGIDQASVVTDRAALARRVQSIGERYGSVLVEQFIAGREFNAALLALPTPTALPVAEIEFGPGNDWKMVTYDAKWTPGSPDYDATPVRCPADVPADVAAEIVRLAVAAFGLMNCRDYARVDFRQDSSGQVHILEVNANPDISPSAGFARALGVAGHAYDDFIRRLVEQARADERRGLTLQSPR